MTPEAQRIAIAEACGYEKPFHRNSDNIPIGGKFKGTLVIDLPDYLNDLNAMHEAEKVLDAVKASDYYCWVLPRVCRETKANMFDANEALTGKATASQRAEAFLRTLGLWKD